VTKREKVNLTQAKKDLIRSVKGVAERAVKAVVKHYGRIKPEPVMLEGAHYGVALAAESFDGEAGPKFEQWALMKAIWTILDECRREGRQTAPLEAARLAAVLHMAFEIREPRDEDAHAPREKVHDELKGRMAGLVTAFLEGLAGTPTSTGGEDEMVRHLDAKTTATKMLSAYEGLSPEQLEIMKCACEADYKKLAAERGVSWWTIQRAHSKLRKMVGARLLGMNLPADPDWDDEVWNDVWSTFVQAQRDKQGKP
jgi:hypothetical protein